LPFKIISKYIKIFDNIVVNNVKSKNHFIDFLAFLHPPCPFLLFPKLWNGTQSWNGDEALERRGPMLEGIGA
jgi:hypothetical protein